MENISEILKYTLPSLIVFLTAYFLIRIYLSNEEKKRKHELSMKEKNTTLPLKLQAFERVVLFLERISPDSLVMRFQKTSLTVNELQSEILQVIRSEFEHNLSQQVYMSPEAWDFVKAARSETVKLINISAAELKPRDSGIILCKRILEKAMELPHAPNRKAILFLKREIHEVL